MSNKDDNATQPPSPGLFGEVHAALAAQLRAGMGFLAPAEEPDTNNLEVAVLVALLESRAPEGEHIASTPVVGDTAQEQDALALRLAELEAELELERKARKAAEARRDDNSGATVVAEAPASAATGEGMRVLIRQLRDIELEVGLHKSELSIGRTGSSDLQFKDPSVSRQHALLRQHDGVAEIIDCDSRNGVYVNDTKVSKQQLSHGDRVMIGTQRFVFICR